jgi:broad specificity phosphatase PhoE
MTQFWLVRHGETAWNAEGRLQGSIDIELNENGISQAHQAAERLKSTPFEAVYSSPLKRAKKTAEIIAGTHGLPVRSDRRLAEVHMGNWEGLRSADIRRDFAELAARRDADPLNVPPPGGENVRHLAVRVLSAADEIAGQHPEGSVLIVSHGLALAALACLANDISLKEVFRYIPDNADPQVIDWQPGRAGLPLEEPLQS